MVVLDPRYAELRRQLNAYHQAHNPTISWCRECQEHHAGPTGLCPICEDEKRRLDSGL